MGGVQSVVANHILQSTSPPRSNLTSASPVEAMDEEELEQIRRINQKQGGTVCMSPPEIPPQNSDQHQEQSGQDNQR